MIQPISMTRTRTQTKIAALFGAVSLLLSGTVFAQIENNIKVKDWPTPQTWWNVSRPLDFNHLQGRYVLLYFWRDSDVHSLSFWPLLQKLQQKYAQELLVVGVFAPKLIHEKNPNHVRQAILKEGILAPVVFDEQFDLWALFENKSWAQAYLISPQGKFLGRLRGAHLVEAADKAIAQGLLKQEDSLAPESLGLDPEQTYEHEAVLSFPGDVLVDAPNNHIYIADSNHHRIVQCDADGSVMRVIGSGLPGLKDGLLEEAQFNKPQGMLLKEDKLYVADTRNHALRVVDLTAGLVNTLPVNPPIPWPWQLAWRESALWVSSPWGDAIYRYDLPSQIRSELPCTKLLSSPRGLLADQNHLFVTLSETGELCLIPLDKEETPRVLIGQGEERMGDRNGAWANALLQKPEGMALKETALYVADCENNQIKKLDLKKQVIQPIAGLSEEGFKDGELGESLFNKPQGLAQSGEKLYVADTNNHQIRMIHLPSNETRTFLLKNLGWPQEKDKRQVFFLPSEKEEKYMAKKMANLNINVFLPEGLELSANNQSFVRWFNSQGEVLYQAQITEIPFSWKLNRHFLEDNAWLEVQIYYNYINNLFRSYVYRQLDPVVLVESGQSESFNVNIDLEQLIPAKRQVQPMEGPSE